MFWLGVIEGQSMVLDSIDSGPVSRPNTLAAETCRVEEADCLMVDRKQGEGQKQTPSAIYFLPPGPSS
jgi:hypothetical protein